MNKENTVYLENVLSVFDGLSGGQVALERAGIKVDKYFASEIDKYAIKVAAKNYPNTVHLGTIENWREWDLPKIDLFLAGFPCQPYSSAGKRLALDDLRGQLIYPMLASIKHFKPRHIFLENVKGFISAAKGEVYRFLLDELKSYGYDIKAQVSNSALVSAQNRERVYFTTWDWKQPEDRHIYLKDILEDKRGVEEQLTLGGNSGGNLETKVLIRRNGHGFVPTEVKLVEKSDTLREATQYNYHIVDKNSYRKLSVVEYEKLQTLKENFTEGVSNSQRFKMCANGFNIETVAHIFRNIKSAEL